MLRALIYSYGGERLNKHIFLYHVLSNNLGSLKQRKIIESAFDNKCSEIINFYSSSFLNFKYIYNAMYYNSMHNIYFIKKFSFSNIKQCL